MLQDEDYATYVWCLSVKMATRHSITIIHNYVYGICVNDCIVFQIATL